MNTTTLTGLVVATYGKSWAVEDDSGNIFHCHALRRCPQPCVGDRVRWQPADAGHGRIVEILPRTTLLTRPGRAGHPRPVAANLDQVLIVIAPEPPYDLLLVDQYLVVCENHDLLPLLVVNKIDLLDPDGRYRLETDLSPYRPLYPILQVSAKTGVGITALRDVLKNRTSLFAGQSGVGKSSLLKTLIPERDIRIGELSATTRRGRHTTTTAMLFHLPEGGAIIDTPGVAIFGLAGIDARKLAYGYKEFRPYIERCRFNDCRHLDDLGCAVQEAVERGEIAPERYRRYRKLMEKLPEIS